MRYFVKILLKNGTTSQRVIQADSMSNCEAAIVAEGFKVLSIKPLDECGFRKQSITTKEILEFTSIMTALLESSLSVKEALKIVENVAKKAAIKGLSSRVSIRLDQGMEFSDAIEMEKMVLPAVYLGLIRIGEKTGNLYGSFKRLAEYIDEENRIRETLSNALVYPAIVLTVLIVGSILLSIFAIPKLLFIFSQLGSSTDNTINVSMRNSAIIFGIISTLAVLLIICIFLLIILRKRGGNIRYAIDSLILKAPLMGSYVLDKQILSFTFSMEVLVSSGIPLEEALKESCGSITNEAVKKSITEVRAKVIRGSSLAEAFAVERVIPSTVVQWLSIGDKTGKTNTIFSSIRAFYQKAMNNWNAKIVSIVEPFISVCVGAIIILVLVLFIIPLFNAIGSIL